MEEDLEAKHMCKLCSKSFPCGRSLGGHMRSHVIYSTDQEKPQKMKKAPVVNNVGSNTSIDADAAGYSLRENPRKTCRFKDLSEDTLLHDKLCKECGKAFQSWKALFGHMKCHSDKITQTRLDEYDSWNSADQSDNGKANPKKKRSLRRTKRYCKMEFSTTTATSSSLSYNANASSSVSEIEQEQEEVALCLIMLSKDGSHRSGPKSVGESSVNYSEFVEAQSYTKYEANQLMGNGGEILELKKKLNGNLRDGPDMNQSEIQVGGLMFNEKLKKSKAVEKLEVQVSEVQMEKNLVSGSNFDRKADSSKKKITSSKRKILDVLEPEMEACDKRSKFECASCNKGFNSFQALGGHRASHNKMKGCFGLKTGDSEKDILGAGADYGLSPNEPSDDNGLIANEMAADNGTKKINKVGSHKCPICFRVFSSGQALGGHKRSHLIADAKNNQIIPSSSIVIQKPVQEIRDFLDLNLPAPDEEDTPELDFNQWWIGSNQKHEKLLDLLSN